METLKFLQPSEVPLLAQRYGTPLFIYDLESIKEKYGYFSRMPNEFGLRVRFSVKSNPNRTILKIFDSLGAYFDVSSVWEARRVINSGIDARKILLTGQEVSDGWIELCREGMEFDAGSLAQLDLYGQIFPGTKVSIRVNPGYGSGLVKKLTSGGNHSSFGIWFDLIDEALLIAEKHKLSINRLHFHIGSGHDASILLDTVSKSMEICRRIPSISVLNLGGGYRVSALSSDPSYDHHEMGLKVSESLKEFYLETERSILLEVEPGTYLTALSGSLLTEVIDRTSNGENGYQFIKLNGGLTELIRPSYYGAVHPLVSVTHEGNICTNVERYMVNGHCCIAGDSFTPVPGNSEDFTPQLLSKTVIGDFIVIERTGGYASSMCLKNFNSYPEAAEVLRINKNNYVLIRKRQTLEQITQNEFSIENSLLINESVDSLVTLS